MASSPVFGDLAQRLQHLRDLGGKTLNAIQHPINTVESALGIPLAPQQSSDPHQQGVDQINNELNMHKNDAANQSFQPRRAMPKK